jgi:RHS repeat-associated protein
VGGCRSTIAPRRRLTVRSIASWTSSRRGSEEETYSYDGLDRRDTKVADGREFDLSYVGLSESLSQEQQFGGEERRTYDYDSALERLGTARRTSPSQTAQYRAYSKDASGSVEGLEDQNGEVGQDRYEYDPYGAQTSSEGLLSDDAKANPFRFQGHYYDSGQQTYDMRARAYLPEIGRFLQEDHFEDAAGDMALEIDPLTQDRYAFLGGNPVNRVEFDGHYSSTSDQRGRYIQTQGGTVQDRETGRSVSSTGESQGSDRSGFEAPPDPPQQSGEAALGDLPSSGMSQYGDKRLAAPPPRLPCNYAVGGTPAAGANGPFCAPPPPADDEGGGMSDFVDCFANEFTFGLIGSTNDTDACTGGRALAITNPKGAAQALARTGGKQIAKELAEEGSERAAKAVTTGQRHHVISTRIGRALERHPSLAGEYSRRDPRFITQAVDEAAHRGYQRWHRDLDEEVVRWLGQNRNVAPKQFESYLMGRYSKTDLRRRFPNGF